MFRWVQPLIDLLEQLPHVEVVLHSSWRHTYKGDLERLKADLPPALAARVTGVTPVKVLERQASIEAYVRRYKVERFVAIDDSVYAFEEGCPWLVVSGPRGLSDPDTIRALREALE